MSFTGKVFILSSATFIIYVGIQIYKYFQPPPLPLYDENEYWGPGNQPSKQDTSIKPFMINVSDEVLNDLKYRLENDRPYTPPLEGIQQQYGFNTNLLKEIIKFWKNDYNWRERETFLNQFPQFITNIQGLDIHYLHIKPKVSSDTIIFPLLLLHGWPTSVREFYSIIPLLTKEDNERNFVFEVVVPSLPGFGFSQPPSKRGLSPSKMAVIFKNLMKRIGHSQFYVQGEDWGGVIATSIATLFPKSILGLHSSMCMPSGPKALIKLFISSLFPSFFVDKRSKHKMFPLLEKFSLLLEEFGYYLLQATKPDTVGIGLGQSPSGMAAYILEKFSTGTNVSFREREDAGLKETFSYITLLDNLMIYWISNSLTTSMRIYSEAYSTHARSWEVSR
ncbi:hypothetical protein RI129_009150 [Pyrocoelia pectoralis]|uniref:Epoxide hydrolase n=1 Tax=Pyrocoelia pectoralis TaxID=417401 RepID=A0AAN7ZKS6_9COLE